MTRVTVAGGPLLEKREKGRTRHPAIRVYSEARATTRLSNRSYW